MPVKPSIVLIGADTARARSYAGAIARSGLGPVNGIFYGECGKTNEKGSDEGCVVDNIWLPEVHKNVSTIFDENGWQSIWFKADSINGPSVVEAIRASGATLGIFAGRGGEIVSASVLEQGVPLLHMHPGKLPEQRGSTTVYYSILEQKPCTVSAILLAPEIDAGPLIAMREYPIPSGSVDVDVLYDCAIRADTLVHVLHILKETGELPKFHVPSDSNNTLYYVIHPLLKHIALMSLGSHF